MSDTIHDADEERDHHKVRVEVSDLTDQEQRQRRRQAGRLDQAVGGGA